MKICYIICSNAFGGVENIVIKSLNELSKYHQVALIAPKNCAFKDKLAKAVKLYEYRSFDKRYNPLLYLEIAKFARDYELIHTHGAKASGIFSVINRFLKKKFVATKHNIRKGAAFNNIQNVIAVSQEVAKTISHPSKILYFGIDHVDVEPKRLTYDFSIISLGRLDFIKGFDKLIRACAKLNFDFALYIVGEGRERAALEQLIFELNLRGKVHLLGFRTDVRELMSGASLQVIASRSEGLPNTLLEGLFYSNMLISTDVGGIGEILPRKFLTDHERLSEKITEIYSNYEKFRNDFAQLAVQVQKNLTLQSYIENLNAYYEEIK